ncbi:hypothetical protein TorRG33x02_186380 [Trema orientale]|uniref:Uncharacterized protein n=1 Tax=Trema orientale TaxID=63057 RepID=A0A2P5EJB6_TREOI|nr:hypothetical protein TorRG33x02_186380 [Trema orientale]
MKDGFHVHRADIFHAINRLKKLKMNKRALEVMEWLIRERPYRPRELDYSYLLEIQLRFMGYLFLSPRRVSKRAPLYQSSDCMLGKAQYRFHLPNEHNIKGLMKVFSDMKRVKVEPNEISYCIVATAHAVARLYTIAEA